MIERQVPLRFHILKAFKLADVQRISVAASGLKSGKTDFYYSPPRSPKNCGHALTNASVYLETLSCMVSV